jgi:hypothetical protein
VSLAALGQRHMDQGLETIDDDWLRQRLRRQARSLLVRACLAAAAVTVALALLPGR